MKKSRVLLAGFLVCAFLRVQTLEAYIEACYDYGDRSCDAEWCFGINGLYWKPCGTDHFSRSIPVYDLQFGESAAVDGVNIQSKKDALYDTSNPDYTLGFDLFLVREIPDCYASLRLNWAHLSVDDSFHSIDSYEGGESEAEKITMLTNFFENNPGKKGLTIDYDRINFRASRSFYTCENAKIAGFFGLAYMRLDQERENWVEFPETHVSSLVNYKDSADLTAGLGEIGVSGMLDFCPWYVSGEFGVLTGVGSRDARLKGTSYQYTPSKQVEQSGLFSSEIVQSPAMLSEEGVPIKVGKGSDTLCFTGLEYKFEVGFTGAFWCFDWKFHAGYEGIFFHDLGAVYKPGSSSGQFNLSTGNIGFAGPFVGITACCSF